MLGAIAGDIIGSRFEGHPAPPDGFDLFHPACRFTDDTVCTLAVADALATDGDFARALRRAYARHPHAGYGGMFARWAGTPGHPPYGSWGNGAPMRTAACAWWTDDPTEARRLAAAQAAVSHDHADAMAGAEAVTLAILRLRTGHGIEAVAAEITDLFAYDLAPGRALARRGFDVSAAGTVPPALAAAFSAPDWESAVRCAVGLGGDTDTLAAIAGAVAEALYGIPAGYADRARRHLTPDLSDRLSRFGRMAPSK